MKKGLSLDVGLEGRARLVLDAIRKDGHQVDTWEQCYNPKLRTSLDNGNTYHLPRETTHAIHNPAKRAGYQLGKIWRKPAARRGL